MGLDQPRGEDTVGNIKKRVGRDVATNEELRGENSSRHDS